MRECEHGRHRLSGCLHEHRRHPRGADRAGNPLELVVITLDDPWAPRGHPTLPTALVLELELELEQVLSPAGEQRTVPSWLLGGLPSRTAGPGPTTQVDRRVVVEVAADSAVGGGLRYRVPCGRLPPDLTPADITPPHRPFRRRSPRRRSLLARRAGSRSLLHRLAQQVERTGDLELIALLDRLPALPGPPAPAEDPTALVGAAELPQSRRRHRPAECMTTVFNGPVGGGRRAASVACRK